MTARGCVALLHGDGAAGARCREEGRVQADTRDVRGVEVTRPRPELHGGPTLIAPQIPEARLMLWGFEQKAEGSHVREISSRFPEKGSGLGSSAGLAVNPLCPEVYIDAVDVCLPQSSSDGVRRLDHHHLCGRTSGPQRLCSRKTTGAANKAPLVRSEHRKPARSSLRPRRLPPTYDSKVRKEISPCGPAPPWFAHVDDCWRL